MRAAHHPLGRRVGGDVVVVEHRREAVLDPPAGLPAEQVGQLDGLPAWASTYLLCALGMESMVPWDPHTERVAGRLRIVDPASPLPQRKKVLRAALQSVPAEDPLRLHHLFVEHGKKTCHEEDPKCPKCPISRDCDWYSRRSRGGAKAAKITGGSNGVER